MFFPVFSLQTLVKKNELVLDEYSTFQIIIIRDSNANDFMSYDQILPYMPYLEL